MACATFWALGGVTVLRPRSVSPLAEERRMRKVALATVVLTLLCLVPVAASAQVKGVYWTTSGMFGPFNMQELVPSLPKEKARDIVIPVNMWVIDHPKGLVLFDT